jgi:hypothetical protein
MGIAAWASSYEHRTGRMMPVLIAAARLQSSEVLPRLPRLQAIFDSSLRGAPFRIDLEIRGNRGNRGDAAGCPRARA